MGNIIPEGWFTGGILNKGYFWSPTPETMEVATDMLSKTIHNNTNVPHVMILPLFMNNMWIKKLIKGTYLVFITPNGIIHWGHTCHGPYFAPCYYI